MTIRHIFIIALLTLMAASHGYGDGEVITEFTAVNQSGSTILEWSTASESGVVEFRIQRSFDGQQFQIIERVDPKGDNQSYRYVDDDLYKARLDTYYYRIEIAFESGRTHLSETLEVTLSFSNVRRTWGSLKAIFR